jgi:predicted Rossmann fold flavoprotein
MIEHGMREIWDVIILGAGGAGMMCARVAGLRGKSVLVIDHSEKLGKKILISGGGRCNFTNINASPKNYFSKNEHFAKSAMARFSPSDFVALVEKHGIKYYEKKLGQLFCVDSAQRIVDLLKKECDDAGVEFRMGCQIESVEKSEEGFMVSTSQGTLKASSVVVATGGLSIPKIGATDIGHKIARKFGLAVTQLDPALVMLTFPQAFWGRFVDISGASVDCIVEVNGKKFRENILFTHQGLSGPAILQASLYWFPGEKIRINLSPERDLEAYFLEKKKETSKKEWKNILAELITERLAQKFAEEFGAPEGPLNQIADAKLKSLAYQLHNWELAPAGNGGYGRAEVTRGGVNTDELSSKTLESKKVHGLYFIGEVVDVTGMLGGYNFQWAWASGAAAGESV